MSEKGIKLDGERAFVSGRLNDYATVWSYSNQGGVQFSWDTVRRIVREGGEFKS
jgi:hypothetical protein